MIMIFGTFVKNDGTSRRFFHFFKILIFQIGRGREWVKRGKNGPK